MCDNEANQRHAWAASPIMMSYGSEALRWALDSSHDSDGLLTCAKHESGPRMCAVSHGVGWQPHKVKNSTRTAPPPESSGIFLFLQSEENSYALSSLSLLTFQPLRARHCLATLLTASSVLFSKDRAFSFFPPFSTLPLKRLICVFRH